MELVKPKEDHSLSEKAYQTIYKRILSGKLKPGDKITEVGISKSMGISQAPVREALKRLAEDNLVVLVPRSGCFIASLTPEEIEEIYEIRKLLEGLAMRYAFTHFHGQKVRELRDAILATARIKHNYADYIKTNLKLDAQFHNMIYQESHCPNLRKMLEKLRVRMQVLRVRTADYVGEMAVSPEEHVEILNCILQGNQPRAVELLTRHIDNTKNIALSSARQKMD